MQYTFCPKCNKVLSVHNTFPANYAAPYSATLTSSSSSGTFTYTNPNTFQPTTTVYPLSVEFCTCRIEADQDVYDDAIGRLHKKELDDVYTERNKCVALLVSMALGLGLKAGIGMHEDKEGETWDDDWRHIAFIDLPAGQVSWHLHDSEMAWFEGAPKYTGKWDGHSTETKYERILEMCKYPDDEE